MATTVGTTTRMVPQQGEGSTSNSELDEIELGGTVAVGDVLVIDGASGAVEDNSAPVIAVGSTPVGIIGVAAQAGVDTNVVKYHPALPGRKFEANIINGAADVAAPTTNALLQDMYGIIESADGFACLDVAGALEVTMPVGWGRQTRGAPAGHRWIKTTPKYSALPTNPRVIFVFNNTVWNIGA